MTGKELKAFAETVHDEAIVGIRTSSYGEYVETFEMAAVLRYTAKQVVESKGNA